MESFPCQHIVGSCCTFFLYFVFLFTWKRQQWNKQCNNLITSTKTSNPFVFSMPKTQKTRDAKGPTEIFNPQFLRCLPKGIKPSRKLNPSQMDALDSAAANTLTLIQGPPGAKKTLTWRFCWGIEAFSVFFFRFFLFCLLYFWNCNILINNEIFPCQSWGDASIEKRMDV